MQVELAAPADTPEIRQIWKTCFGDTDSYMNAFFKAVYSPSQTLVCRHAQAVIGAAQFFPHTALVHGKEEAWAYIGGVSVLPRYRGQGVATKLLEVLENMLFSDGFSTLFLVPARFSIYRRMGYTGLSCLSDFTGKTEALRSFVEAAPLPEAAFFPCHSYDQFISDCPVALKRTIKSLDMATALLEGASLAAIGDEGYMLYKEANNTFTAYECVYQSEEALRRLLGRIALSPCENFCIRSRCDGMLRKILFDAAFCESHYPHVMQKSKGEAPPFSTNNYINMLGWF